MFQLLNTYCGHDDSVLCCEALGQTLASGGQDGKLLLWDTVSCACVHELPLPSPDPVSAVVFSKLDASKLFAAAGNSVYHWDLANVSHPLAAFTVNTDEVNAIAVSADGRFLAAGDDAAIIQVIDLTTGSLFKTLRAVHDNIVTSVLFRHNSPWSLLSGGLDQRIVSWDVSRGRAVDKLLVTQQEDGGGMLNPPMVHGLAACSGATGQLKDVVAVARGDGVVELLSMPASRKASVSTLTELAGQHTCAASCTAFLHALPKQLLVSGGEDGRVVVWDWQCQQGQQDEHSRVAWSKRQRSKPNGLCSAATAAGGFFVSDTSKKLKQFGVAA